MNIAMLTNNYKPFVAGVPISVERLATSLREMGHTVYLFAPAYEGQEEEAYVIRIPSIATKVKGAVIPKLSSPSIWKKLWELEIDLIHVHHPFLTGNMALFLKEHRNIPVIFTYHTQYEQYAHYLRITSHQTTSRGSLQRGIESAKKKWIRQYVLWFSDHCDMLFAPSHSMKQYLEEQKIGVPVRVLPTGIGEESFYPDRMEAEHIRQTYAKDRDYLFCSVQRLSKEKNIDLQIKGLALLKDTIARRGKSFRMLIIGEGPQREELESLIREEGLQEEVILLGNIPNEEIKNYHGACDLYLFTSQSETQGIVLLEAMAVGNPVIAVAGNGVDDLVIDGVTGWRTACDSLDWCNAIDRVLLAPNQLESMRLFCIRQASRYSQEKIAREALEAYDEVMRRSKKQVAIQTQSKLWYTNA